MPGWLVRSSRPRRRWSLVAALLVGGACAAPPAPELEGPPLAPDWAHRAAITLEIDLVQRTAAVVADGHALGRSPLPVTVEATALHAGAVGVDAPAGRRRVQLGVRIRSATPATAFAPSSVVSRPPGGDGALLIPIEATVVPEAGRASVVDGTSVVVELPSAGRVTPNADFNGDGSPGSGAPFAFFDARRCTARPDRACFRYEVFAQTPERRAVGFDVDPMVRRFRARLLIATDLTSP